MGRKLRWNREIFGVGDTLTVREFEDDQWSHAGSGCDVHPSVNDDLATQAPMRSRASITLLATAVTSACGVDEGPAPLIVRDSLGVRIVEAQADEIESRWHVSDEPEWVFGGIGSGVADQVLYGVADVRQLNDGWVVIAESSTQELIWVRPETGEIRRWGGEGDGPHEFRGIATLIDVAPGVVGVHDVRRSRYLEVARSGEVRSVTPIPPVQGTGFPVLRQGGGAHGDPRLFLGVVSGLPEGPHPGPYRGTGPVLRLGPTVDTLTAVHGATVFSGDEVSGSVLFGATTLFAGSRLGLWMGDTAREEVSLWAGPGDPEAMIRWTRREDRSLRPERREKFWTHLTEGVSDQERASFERMRSMVVFADSVPAFGSLLSDAEGNLWVGSHVPPEVQLGDEPWPAQTWLVFVLDEPAVHQLITPDGLRVFQVGEGFVVGVHKDGLGVESVRRYRLSQTPDAGT